MDSKSPSSILDAPPATPASKLPLRKSGRGSKQTAGDIQPGRHACVFWIGAACYALDVAYVSEIIANPIMTLVPKSVSGVMGMCNLRGTPLDIVDLGAVLEIPHGNADAAPRKQFNVLVLRSRHLSAGARIDKADSICHFDRVELKPSTTSQEHPAVKGLLEIGPGVVATLLDGEELFARLNALKFRKQRAD